MEVMRPTRDQWKSIYFISLTNCLFYFIFCLSQLYIAFSSIILFTISLYHQVLLLLLLDASIAAGAVIKYWLLFPLSLSFNIFFAFLCFLTSFFSSSPYDSEIGIMYVKKQKKKKIFNISCMSKHKVLWEVKWNIWKFHIYIIFTDIVFFRWKIKAKRKENKN